MAKKVVLIVEDDEFLLDSYKVKLKKEDFDLLLARDGEEAIHILGTHTPDLVVLDLVMPVMDGLEVLKHIRENSAWNQIPVIVASNLDTADSVKKAKQLGAADYFIKSEISINELVEKCRQYFA